MKPQPIDQEDQEPNVSIEAVTRLSKDLKIAITTLNPREVRFLVDAYYQLQENRKRAANQLRSLNATGEPHAVIDWLNTNNAFLEKQIKAALLAWSESQHMGRFAMAFVGIGPVISAGLLAHIDITKAPTVGHVWSFAGLTTGFNCPVQWKKGERRPWNASLKTLVWKATDCFKKFSGREDCFYGKLYQQQKAKLIVRNEAGEFKLAADDGLTRVGKNTEAYKSYAKGKLPPGHVDARAMRWVGKMFLSHWWEEAYRHHYQKEPPAPYAIVHLGHAHKIEPPKSASAAN